MVTSSAALERVFKQWYSSIQNFTTHLQHIKNNGPQLMSTHQVGIDWGDTYDD